jgi:hypothetical protein
VSRKQPATTRPGARRGSRIADQIIDQSDASLVDVVDNLLNQGVVLSGDLMLGIAGIDLIYARLAVLLAAADRLRR